MRAGWRAGSWVAKRAAADVAGVGTAVGAAAGWLVGWFGTKDVDQLGRAVTAGGAGAAVGGALGLTGWCLCRLAMRRLGSPAVRSLERFRAERHARIHRQRWAVWDGAKLVDSAVAARNVGHGQKEKTSAPSRSIGCPGAEMAKIDLAVAPPMRIATYGDGGDAHFSVDRDVAEQIFATVPGGIDAFQAAGRAGQEFLERAIRHMIADAGVHQFLVTGCNLAGEANVHDVAQAIAPDVRVVYLVLDPVMLAHAHRLQRGSATGVTAYVQAKMRDTDEVLHQAAATLDLSQPVGVVLPATLPFVRRYDTAHRIVSDLMAGASSGSYLALTHHASDILVDDHVEMFRCIARLAAEGKTWALVPRSHAEVSRFFEGVDLVEPGVVPMWSGV